MRRPHQRYAIGLKLRDRFIKAIRLQAKVEARRRGFWLFCELQDAVSQSQIRNTRSCRHGVLKIIRESKMSFVKATERSSSRTCRATWPILLNICFFAPLSISRSARAGLGCSCVAPSVQTGRMPSVHARSWRLSNPVSRYIEPKSDCNNGSADDRSCYHWGAELPSCRLNFRMALAITALGPRRNLGRVNCARKALAQ